MSATNFQDKPNIKAPKMPNEWIQKALDVFEIPSTSYNETSISLHIIQRLEEMELDYEIDNYGNILVTKGISESYPCFCAHLDTVHMYKNGFNVKHNYNSALERDYVYAENDKKGQVGIGGDDKCGIFVCLFLLETISAIKVAFFSQEESGGTGSNNVDISWFLDCNFLGGIDRWNGHDFINKYEGSYTISKELHRDTTELRKKFGYYYASGLFTDAFNVMGRRVDISCFNLSCGYYSHHSDGEYVDLNELWNCCLFATELCKLPQQYYFERPVKVYPAYIPGRIYHGLNDLDSNAYHSDWWKTQTIKYCISCGIELMETEKDYCYTCKKYLPANIDDEIRVF